MRIKLRFFFYFLLKFLRHVWDFLFCRIMYRSGCCCCFCWSKIVTGDQKYCTHRSTEHTNGGLTMARFISTGDMCIVSDYNNSDITILGTRYESNRHFSISISPAFSLAGLLNSFEIAIHVFRRIYIGFNWIFV